MRGGKREGAGRPKGLANVKSALDKKRFAHEMQCHLETAIATLVDVAQNGKSESARVSAATEIINRAVGRPAVTESDGEIDSQLFSAIFEHDAQELRDAGLGPVLDTPLVGLFDD